MVHWPGAAALHINYLEVLALEPAAHLWAAQWANKIIKVHTDKQAACAIINRGTAHSSFVIDSLRGVFWLSAIYNFKISAVYYPGDHNVIADAVSHIHEPAAWTIINSFCSVTLLIQTFYFTNFSIFLLYH